MVQELAAQRVVVPGVGDKPITNTYPHKPVLAFTSFFIGDFPMLGVAGIGKAVLSVFAALLATLGVKPQWKKVLPEGAMEFWQRSLTNPDMENRGKIKKVV